MDDQTFALIGLLLFCASEAIGLSKLRSNSVVQLILQIAMRAFPYEPRARETPENGSLFKLGGRDGKKDHRRKRNG